MRKFHTSKFSSRPVIYSETESPIKGTNFLLVAPQEVLCNMSHLVEIVPRYMARRYNVQREEDKCSHLFFEWPFRQMICARQKIPWLEVTFDQVSGIVEE